MVISTPSINPISGYFNCPGVLFNYQFSAAFTAPSNITILATDYVGYDFSVTPNPMIVEADDDVTVHVFYSYSNFVSEWLIGSANIMPIDSLGNTYFVASYAPYSSRKSAFTISSLDNTTTVEIRASNGERYNEVLEPYSTFQLQSSTDLTGSYIKSDRPISVMSGSSCSKVPISKHRCNYLLVHLTDVESAGTHFVMSPFKDNDEGYIFRVVATVDNTIVRINPGNVTQEIHAREFYEMNVMGVMVVYITATKPVLVFQYGKGGDETHEQGDPLMVVVPAIEHFVHTVTFPVVYLPTRRESLYSISVIIRCRFVDEGLLLDGRNLGELN